MPVIEAAFSQRLGIWLSWTENPMKRLYMTNRQEIKQLANVETEARGWLMGNNKNMPEIEIKSWTNLVSQR